MARALTVLLLSVAAGAALAGGPLTGFWNAPPAALPNQQLPDVPLLGNGGIGVLLDAHGSAGGTAGIGPGRLNTLDLWIGSGSFWSCRNCKTPAKGCCGAIALGGVSISLLPTFPGTALNFSAAQVTSSPPNLQSTWTLADGSGVLTTTTYLFPSANIIGTQLSWNTTGGGSAPANLTLNVSTWVLGANPSAHAGPMPTLAGCVSVDPIGNGTAFVPCPRTPNASIVTAVSRAASNVGVDGGGPHPVWAGLATSVYPPAAATAFSAASPVGTGQVWGSTTLVTVPANVAAVYLYTIENEELNYTGPDPSFYAARFAGAFSMDAGNRFPFVVVNTAAFWNIYWQRASVSLGDGTGLPEAMWYGAQYILCSTTPPLSYTLVPSTLPPPALYGVWVTSDTANWNGDYTLDYNSESTFFGAFASRQGTQVATYAQPLLDWLPAGQKLAQELAAQANITCPASAAVYACHLAPWGFQSDDQSRYMMWNLNFALLPLVSMWEFTRFGYMSADAQTILPMFAAATDWWACYLVKVPTPDGRSYVYHDANPLLPDNEHENQAVPDPQIGLALIARTCAAHIDISVGLGLGVPAAAADILAHLAPFNVGSVRYRPSGPRTYNTTQNWRFSGDYHMGTAPNVTACEAACDADASCECFTFCPSPSVDGCPDGPSCWFYTNASGGHAGPGFTAGCASGPPPPPEELLPVWTAYANATPAESDTFAFYPTYPAEALGGLLPLPEALRSTAQTSVRTYTPDWVNSGRPLDVFVAAILALSGAGDGPTASPIAYSAEDIYAGLTAYLQAYLGRNQLARAPGGGVENVGVSRAVTEMLLGSTLFVPAGSGGENGTAQWVTRLFPAWPKSMSASFYRLVAKGALVFTASYDATSQAIASPVNVQVLNPVDGPLPTQNVTLRMPWPGAPQSAVTVTCGGQLPQDVVWLDVPEGNSTAPALSFVIGGDSGCWTILVTLTTVTGTGVTGRLPGGAITVTDVPSDASWPDDLSPRLAVLDPSWQAVLKRHGVLA